MNSILIGAIGLIVMLVLLLAGVNVGFTLAAIGSVGLFLIIGPKATVSYVASNAFSYTISSAFLVLPCFILMGLLVMETGIGPVAYRSLNKLFGRAPAGLGISTVAGCALFGAMIGTAGSTAMIFGKIACPEMRKYGYDKKFAYGLVSASSLLGMLIPPSTLAVVYGVVTGESIGKLLFGGVGPGIVLALLYCGLSIIMVLRNPSLAPRYQETVTWKERGRAIVDLWPILLVGLVVVGGIYGGVFTPLEAGAWGCVVVIAIGAFQKTIGFKQIWNAVEETVGMCAMVFIVLTGGRIFSKFLTISGLSQVAVNWITNTVQHPWQLVAAMVILYLILGCFLEANSIIMITIPVMYPAVHAMGIDPIWFGMVLILALHAGMITPPLGMVVYSVKSVAPSDVSLEDIFSGIWPFLAMVVLCTALVIIFPQIATWLPGRMFG